MRHFFYKNRFTSILLFMLLIFTLNYCAKNAFYGLEPSPNDSEGPVINIINPTEGQGVSGILMATGTASDKYSVSKVEISVDGEPYVGCSGANVWSYGVSTANLTTGAHYFNVRATDNNGNVSIAKRNFIVDTAVPNITANLNLANFENYIKGTNISLSGTATSTSGIDKVMVSLDGGVTYSNAALSGNSWIFNIADSATVKPGDGTVTMVLKAVNKSGLIGLTSIPLVIDNTAPVITITSPVSGNAYIYGNNLIVSGNCSDNTVDGVKSISITIGTLSAESVSCLSGGNFTLTKDVSSISSYSITAIITDKANNTAQVIVDLSLTQKVATPVFVTTPGTYTEAKSVLISVDTAGASIRYTKDGSDPTCSSGYAYSGGIPVLSTVTIKAIACKSGIVDSEIATGTYTINDSGSPSVTVLNPIESQKVSGLVTIVGEANDNIGISLVEYSIDGGAYQTAVGTMVWYKILDTSTLSEGNHSITVRVTDGTGNQSSITRNFSVDQTIPNVSVSLNYANFENYIKGNNIVLSGSSSDNNGVAKVQISFNGGVTFYDAVLDAGTTSRNWSYNISDTSAVIPGNGSITGILRVVDVTGIIGTTNFPLVIDNEIPTGSISSPSNNVNLDLSAYASTTYLSYVGGKYILAVNGSCSDNITNGVKEVLVELIETSSSTLISSKTVSCDNGYFVTPSTINGLEIPVIKKNAGDAYLRATVKDKAGNQSSPIFNYLTLDDDPPTFTLPVITGKGTLDNDLSKSANNFKSGNFVISGTVDDLSGKTDIKEIRIKMDAYPSGTNVFDTLVDCNGVGTVGLCSAQSTGAWSHKLDTSLYADGSYTLIFTVIDNANGKAYMSRLIRIDKTNPTLSIFSPTDGSIVGGNSADVNGYADGTGSSLYELQFTIKGNVSTYTGPNFTGLNSYMNGFFMKNFNPGLYVDPIDIVVKATDLAGNTFTITPINVSKDPNVPMITYVRYNHPSNSTYINKDLVMGRYINGSGTIHGQVTDADGTVDSVKVRIDGASWSANLVTSGANVTWGYTLPGLSPGTHTIEVQAIDNSAKTVTNSIQFYVDNSSPSLSALNLAMDDSSATPYYHGKVNVTGNASDSSAGIEAVVMTVDETPGNGNGEDPELLTNTGDLNSFSALWDTEAMPKLGGVALVAKDGIRVEVTVTDKAGNPTVVYADVNVRPWISGALKYSGYLGEAGLVIYGENLKHSSGNPVLKIGDDTDAIPTNVTIISALINQITFSLPAAYPTANNLKSGPVIVNVNNVYSGMKNSQQAPVKIDLFYQQSYALANGSPSAVAISDKVHLSYTDNSGGSKFVRYYDGTNEYYVAAKSGGNFSYIGIGYDPVTTNKIIAYNNGANLYIVRSTGTFSGTLAPANNTFPNLVQTISSASFNSMKVDSTGTAHLVYFVPGTGAGTGLMYVKSTDAFSTMSAAETLEQSTAAGTVGQFCQLTLDSANRPHVVYVDITNKKTKYVYYNGTGWSAPITVDTDAGSYGAGIALGSDDSIHIAYYDVLNGDLKYAYADYAGATFANTTIDAPYNSGYYPSIAVDNSNNPHITYMESVFSTAKYAYKKAGVWKAINIMNGATVTTNTFTLKNSLGEIHMIFMAGGTVKRCIYLAEY